MIDLGWSQLANTGQSASDAFENMQGIAKIYGQPLTGSGTYKMTRQMVIDVSDRGKAGFKFEASSRGQLIFDLTDVDNEVPVLVTADDHIGPADMQAYLELKGMKFLTRFDGPGVQFGSSFGGDQINALDADFVVLNTAKTANAMLVEVNQVYGTRMVISGTGGEAGEYAHDIQNRTKNHTPIGTRGVVLRNCQMMDMNLLVSGCTIGLDFAGGTSTSMTVRGSIEICKDDVVMTSGAPWGNDFLALQTNARDYAFTAHAGHRNTIRRSVNNNSPGGSFLHPTALVGLTVE